MYRQRTASRSAASMRAVRGFTLIEMMVAIVMGMLLTAGIITLFSGTTGTNKIQDGLARLQENGRFALTRVDSDLRMLSGQYCSNFAGSSQATTNGPQMSQRAPWTFAASLNLPDATPVTYGTATAVSPRLFVQGYECSSGTCTPALPAGFPAVGTADGDRLQGTDVLTIRYLTGTGWPVSTAPVPSCASGGTITLDPQAGDDTPETGNPVRQKFAAGDIALYSDCQNPSLFPVAGYGGNVITLGSVLAGGAGGAPYCKAAGNRDTRMFNFSKDFITVTYFVKLVDSHDPDANGLVPTLVRRVNGTDQDLVQGIDRLDFVYGVRNPAGTVTYQDASTIEASADGAGTCIDPPDGVAAESGCLWRSVRSVETHMLFNTVRDLPLTAVDQSFTYSAAPDDPATVIAPAGGASPVTGLAYGKKMRREFVSETNVRNTY